MITTALLALSGVGAAAAIYSKQTVSPGDAASRLRQAAGNTVLAANRTSATLYRNPNCDCCLEYAKYLRSNGFEVTVDSSHDLDAVRKQLHVPGGLEGCHVMAVGGYAVEGHVSVATIDKLLAEKPDIIGISIPGMPAGTPGMTGTKTVPLKVYEITANSGSPKVFATD